MSSFVQDSLAARAGCLSLERSQPSACKSLLALVAADVIGLASGIGLAISIAHLAPKIVDLHSSPPFAALLAGATICYAAFEMYSTAAMDRVQELKELTTCTTLFYAVILAGSMAASGPSRLSPVLLALACCFSLVLVPASRGVLSWLARGSGWWGTPVAVVGTRSFLDRVPTSIPKDNVIPWVPVMSIEHADCSFIDRICADIQAAGIRCVIVESPDLDVASARVMVTKLACVTQRVIYLPGLGAVDGLQVSACEYSGKVALEISNRLRMPTITFLKRAIDSIVSFLLLVLLLPVFVVLTILVKLSSPGPAFYGHLRYGKNGRCFRALKFRSMVQNGDVVLRKFLEENDKARHEWSLTQKLRRDPRVTAIGRFLRLTSLDELPQLWNVVCNDMSLVGPRPIVEDETHRYAEVFMLYKQVPPGITGLWQISGRNNTTYAERVRLDEYYVRNWSIWLDFYILFRTVAVVLGREGAC